MNYLNILFSVLVVSLIGVNICNAQLPYPMPIPSDIPQLLNTIEQEANSYPSREMDMEFLEVELRSGNYSKARSMANDIIKKQRKERALNQWHGVPLDLKRLLIIIEEEAYPYPNRKMDMDSLSKSITDKNYSKASDQADEIIIKQRSIMQQQGIIK